MIDQALVRAARAWRSVAGDKTALEKYVKRRYRKVLQKETGRYATQFSGPNEVVVRAKAKPDEPKVGIFLKGGCDLPTMFLMGPMIRDDLRTGTVAIHRPSESVGSSHSSQLLESSAGIPMDLIVETCRRLEIKRSFFKPVLFEDRFGLSALPKMGSFPKTVVVLSIASDLTRSLHRHREHGFLVDIGGWWLNQSLDKAIKDVDTLRWFKDTFEPVGRTGVHEFQANFESIVKRLNQMGSHTIVLNSLGLDPQNPTHNYQLLNVDQATRRRDFNAAIADLSSSVGFHVLDVDRILKLQGVKEQVDFAHASLEAKLPIAREGYRILRELEVI